MVQPNIILSFDTTGSQDSIAICVDGQITSKMLPQGGSALQSSILIPELIQLLKEKGITLRQVDTLCVLTGPGSFTGIRLGLATAQGIKIATNCQVFAPTLLELLVGYYQGGVPAVDTKRGDYFIKRNGDVSIVSVNDLKEIAANETIVSFDDIPGLSVIKPQFSVAEELICFYRNCGTPSHYGRLEPFYVRTPEFAKKKTLNNEEAKR